MLSVSIKDVFIFRVLKAFLYDCFKESLLNFLLQFQFEIFNLIKLAEPSFENLLEDVIMELFCGLNSQFDIIRSFRKSHSTICERIIILLAEENLINRVIEI